FPTLPGLKTAIVETCEERPRIDSCNLDAKFLKFQAHRLRDGFNRMLRCGIDSRERVHVQAFSRRHPHDSTLAALYHLLGNPLCQQQRSDHVDLEFVAHVWPWNVENRPALQNPGVVHQDLDVPSECLLSFALIRNVEFLDSQGDTACGRFALQRLNLSVYFDRSDHIEALPGKSHCYFMSKTSPSSCNQDHLHHWLLSGSMGICFAFFSLSASLKRQSRSWEFQVVEQLHAALSSTATARRVGARHNPA